MKLKGGEISLGRGKPLRFKEEKNEVLQWGKVNFAKGSSEKSRSGRLRCAFFGKRGGNEAALRSRQEKKRELLL